MIETKTCPYCQDTIPRAAVKCKSCHSNLDPNSVNIVIISILVATLIIVFLISNHIYKLIPNWQF